MTRDGRTLTYLITNASRNYYYRATLDFDGVFTLYYHPKVFEGSSTPRWMAAQGQPTDPRRYLCDHRVPGEWTVWLQQRVPSPECKCPLWLIPATPMAIASRILCRAVLKPKARSVPWRRFRVLTGECMTTNCCVQHRARVQRGVPQRLFLRSCSEGAIWVLEEDCATL